MKLCIIKGRQEKEQNEFFENAKYINHVFTIKDYYSLSWSLWLKVCMPQGGTTAIQFQWSLEWNNEEA